MRKYYIIYGLFFAVYLFASVTFHSRLASIMSVLIVILFLLCFGIGCFEYNAFLKTIQRDAPELYEQKRNRQFCGYEMYLLKQSKTDTVSKAAQKISKVNCFIGIMLLLWFVLTILIAILKSICIL